MPDALPDYDKQRPRHKVVHTRTVDGNPVYSSVGHYRLHPGLNHAYLNPNLDISSLEPEPDYLSESDDEYQLLPGAWEREKHLANLRDQAYSDDEEGRPEGLSQSKIDFMVKWDSHRMDEGLGSTKFIGDCIVRFARKKRAWLRGEGDAEGKRITGDDDGGGWLEFVKFLEKVKDRREIDDRLVVGIWGIVWGKGKAGVEVEIEADEEDEDEGRYRLNGPNPRSLVAAVQNPLHDDHNHNTTAYDRSSTTASSTTVRNVHSSAVTTARELYAILRAQPPNTCGHCHKDLNAFSPDSRRCADKAECMAPAVVFHAECLIGEEGLCAGCEEGTSWETRRKASGQPRG